MTNWSDIASFATAGGTLVLAVATFSSVRSANRSARIAEEGFLTRLRPLLVPSSPDDPTQKLMWGDEYHTTIAGGRAVFEHANGVIYVAMALRNMGSGIALLHGWHPYAERVRATAEHPDPDDFRRLTIDLFIPPGGTGYFLAAVRDEDDPLRPALLASMESRQSFTIDLLYGDLQGHQRSISRFGVFPAEPDGWFCRASQHWNLDGPAPR